MITVHKNQNIRAVVFDCFGVLARNSWLPFQKEHFGHRADLMALTTDLNNQCDAGAISFDTFIKKIAALADTDYVHVHTALTTVPLNTPLFDYIASNISDRYKVGLLSNVGTNIIRTMFNREQYALFDAIALSFEIGYSKPQVEAFETIAHMLHISPSEALFIDDQPLNIRGAQACGMATLQYTALPTTIRGISQVLHK